ncbi:MAG TPA: hypothetical protein DCQ31_01070 [Bacteroidales bacterium]|nr:hypothetical protein [Bacteroidales bacterium]
MESPNIIDKKPVLETVQPGTYFWCACGNTKRNPYCDGSHKTTDFTPVKVEFKTVTKVAWCSCKFTGTPPKCDGTHNTL